MQLANQQRAENQRRRKSNHRSLESNNPNPKTKSSSPKPHSFEWRGTCTNVPWAWNRTERFQTRRTREGDTTSRDEIDREHARSRNHSSRGTGTETTESNREIRFQSWRTRGGETTKSIENARETGTILAGGREPRARVRGSKPAKHESTERSRGGTKGGRPWGSLPEDDGGAAELGVQRPTACGEAERREEGGGGFGLRGKTAEEQISRWFGLSVGVFWEEKETVGRGVGPAR